MERGLGHGGHMLDLDHIIDRCAARLVAERRGIQLHDSPPSARYLPVLNSDV